MMSKKGSYPTYSALLIFTITLLHQRVCLTFQSPQPCAVVHCFSCTGGIHCAFPLPLSSSQITASIIFHHNLQSTSVRKIMNVFFLNPLQLPKLIPANFTFICSNASIHEQRFFYVLLILQTFCRSFRIKAGILTTLRKLKQQKDLAANCSDYKCNSRLFLFC